MGINQFVWLHVKQPMWYYSNEIVLKFRKACKSKSKAMRLMPLLIPVLLVRWIFIRIYEVLIGNWWVSYLNNRDSKKSWKYDIGIVSISKNEAPYITEWIEYHRLTGGGEIKFYFYNNDSDDETAEIIKPYVDHGIVEYTLIHGIGKQLEAYNDAIKRHKDECKWMAFIDMDEYIFPMDGKDTLLSLTEKLTSKAGNNASGLAIRWALFGSNGLEKTPEGLTTENFLRRGEYKFYGNAHVKCIVNPRRVKDYISAHYPLFQYGAYAIAEYSLKRNYLWSSLCTEWKNIRINHYYCKSKEQFIRKTSRGLGDRAGSYKKDAFERYNLNDIYDDGMLRYAKHLKQIIDGRKNNSSNHLDQG